MTKTLPLNRLRFTELVREGDVIAWPQGPGEPLALTEALVAQRAELPRPELLYGLTTSNTLRPEYAPQFRFRGFNGAYNSRRVSDLAEIIPSHLHTFPALIRSRRVKVDIALIQVRPHPAGGFTQGVICDFSGALVDAARLVIALVNPALPVTGEDALVGPDDIDLLVESDARIIEMPDAEPSEVERRVAARVAELIPDRATIQLGVGTLPSAVAAALSHHRELGVHSGVVSDVLVDLVDKGIVTNAHKGRDAGVTVTGGLFGTARLRDFAERSGQVSMRDVEYTHALGVTGSLHAFHAINAAIEVDLYGASNTEVAGGRYLGAIGGGVDFVRGGAASPGGRSILAFPSTTPDGKVSRIVASLDGRPVTGARSDADVVVTEHGVAELRGASLRERARQLLEIAHPDFRESLERSLSDSASTRNAP
jgi:acetyl-CoA hydrolase